ncbi:unnamed protein product [Cylicostephanus goldi]|uniref:Uncharacterized protein n=1 Tax=Cylicostephanus goldi TaxID=71465 RepID=A0A3P6RPI3_CYLGO|nr:unnamed protein product [Cylicostephanus goldi]
MTSGASSTTLSSVATNRSVATGSILSGVSTASVESTRTLAVSPTSSTETRSTRSTASAPQLTQGAKIPHAQPPADAAIGQFFDIPPEFYKHTCKLDTSVRPLERIKETDVIEDELRKIDAEKPEEKARRERNRWTLMNAEDRRVKPAL